jgi:hypothetical protein
MFACRKWKLSHACWPSIEAGAAQTRSNASVLLDRTDKRASSDRRRLRDNPDFAGLIPPGKPGNFRLVDNHRRKSGGKMPC